MVSFLATAALSAITYGAVGSAAALQRCSPGASNVCFQVAVPQSSSSSNSGNIYFQISAPTSYAWVALGTGGGMIDANIFLMYQDGKGNVTISNRRATSYTMPTEVTDSSAAQLTLLAGSGVSGNTMTANVMCSNCNSWTGGDMSLSSTSSDWIAAWNSGSLSSTSKSARINQHDAHDSFGLDLTKATVAADSNPFVAAGGNSGSGTGTGTGTAGTPTATDANTPTSTGSNTGSGSGTGSGNGSSDGVSSGGSQSGTVLETSRFLTAHGVIMSIVFVLLFPIGSVLMPLLGNWMLHAAVQFITFLLMWAGFALGYICSQRLRLNFSVAHTQLGIVVVCAMVLQPAFGYIHHAQYLKHQSRGAISYVHIYYGRVLMLLGVINGGLGLQLASESSSLVIAYSVVSAIVFVVYAAAKFITSRRKQQSNPRAVRLSGSSGGEPAGRGKKESGSDDIELSNRRGL